MIKEAAPPAQAAAPRHIPTATYRLQFNASFGFARAAAVAPYLARLGVSDLYASPIFKARTGSAHGYDVVDPNRLNPELGSEKEFRDLLAEARRRGLSWLQDIVPNHMAFDGQNDALMDVLESGRNSKYRKFFDIDWDHPLPSLHGRLLAPFLDKPYAEALNAGEIQLRYDERGISVCCRSCSFPLRIGSYPAVLGEGREGLEARLGARDPDLALFDEALASLESLDRGRETHFHYAHLERAKAALRRLYRGRPEIRELVDRNIRRLNGIPGDEASFDALDALLSAQAFRFAFWRVAGGEIDYRRFFNIDDLICVKVEDEDVFNHTHELVLALAGEGAIAGLRIDHVDGLLDPARYLERVRRRAGPVYIAVEKILADGERLPESWGVHGTTGYDFMNRLNRLFCERRSEKEFSRIYYRFTGLHTPCDELAHLKKLLIISMYMGGTIENLAYLMKSLAADDRWGRDITPHELKGALVELMANFPVYRTYVTHADYSGEDRARVGEALARARARMPGQRYASRFIARFFMLDPARPPAEEDRRRFIDFVMRLQQFTGPLTAKGFEDTVLYVYNRLLSLNEVGGNPRVFGAPPAEFHDAMRERAARSPLSMNATSTHDTKRGEDARARLNVLSELPREWRRRLGEWAALNRAKKRPAGGAPAPDANDEYLIYQTLVGNMPFGGPAADSFPERLKAYAVKAVREAKVHTEWISPDADYERACGAFIDDLLADERFLASFLPFQRKIAFYGVFNSLSQTLLKIACPGIPDFYQGTELWDLSMVDPDNRRPVDFGRRAAVLEELAGRERDAPALIGELLSSPENGTVKLFLIRRALAGRAAHRELFEKGEYAPLAVTGSRRESVVAFARRHGGACAVCVAPRMLTRVAGEGVVPVGPGVWGDTEVAMPRGAGRWTELVGGTEAEWGGRARAGELMRLFPGALLVRG